jgi:hypothetical protein
MSGGAIGGDLLADGEAHVVMRGGTIGGLLEANDTALIEIHGRDFDQPLGYVLATSGTITGFLQDGSAVSIPFTRAIGATIRLVPEPGATVAALAAASTLLAVRRRRSRRYAAPPSASANFASIAFSPALTRSPPKPRKPPSLAASATRSPSDSTKLR